MIITLFLPDTDQTDESDPGSHSGPAMRRGKQPDKRRATGTKKSGPGKQKQSDSLSKTSKL